MTGARYGVRCNGSALEFVRLDAAAGVAQQPTVLAVNDGTWHHVQVLLDPSSEAECRIYVDGRLPA